MARSNHPDTAGTQFFICLDAHGHLDGKYTAFGKVVDDDVSLKTVKAIGAVAVGANDRPRDNVTIQKAVVHENAK
jgi:peptidyl-prolyl cis-trans isomerase B (cyclophilin B)